MVRAALVQFSGHESKERNIRKAEDLARQAASNGAVFIDHRGNVIGRAGDKEDEILYADIDPKACEDTRDLWGFFKFRRP